MAKIQNLNNVYLSDLDDDSENQNEDIVHGDPNQPRYPAGSPDGKGGQFMPLDEFNGLSAEDQKALLGRVERGAKYKENLAKITPPQPPTVAKSLQDMSSAAFKAQIPNPKKGLTIRKTYPELSDAELNARINRIRLEQTYSDMIGDTKYVKSGQEKFNETLQNIGAVAGIAASGAIILGAIATAFKKAGKAPGTTAAKPAVSKK